MKLSTDDLLSLYETAVLAATEAGRLIADHANKSLNVQHKSGGESLASQVITEVDLLSEAVILKHLQPVCEQYDLALLSEESTDDRARLEMDYFWSIDPIDGTLSFIESAPGYAVSIALVSRAGSPIIGVVYDPVTHTIYSAVQGQGAFRNGKPWAPPVHASMEGKPLTLVCDRSLLLRSEYPKIRQAVEAFSSRLGLTGVKTIEDGVGAVINACWALEHSPACYFKLPKAEKGGGCLWDFAAIAAIFLELGAVATDFNGQPLQLNRADYIYMNRGGVLFATHQELARQVRRLLQRTGIR